MNLKNLSHKHRQNPMMNTTAPISSIRLFSFSFSRSVNKNIRKNPPVFFFFEWKNYESLNNVHYHDKTFTLFTYIQKAHRLSLFYHFSFFFLNFYFYKIQTLNYLYQSTISICTKIVQFFLKKKKQTNKTKQNIY